IQGFVDYVATARSWYKHISLLPPGVPFSFFLNPFVAREEGYPYRERTESGFHYSQWLTAKYLEQCGYLDYIAPTAAPAFWVTPQAEPIVPSQKAQHVVVPRAVLDAGTVYVTGVIHSLSAQVGP